MLLSRNEVSKTSAFPNWSLGTRSKLRCLQFRWNAISERVAKANRSATAGRKCCSRETQFRRQVRSQTGVWERGANCAIYSSGGTRSPSALLRLIGRRQPDANVALAKRSFEDKCVPKLEFGNEEQIALFTAQVERDLRA